MHGEAGGNIHIGDLAVGDGADHTVGHPVGQKLHGVMAHLRGGHAVAGIGGAAALDMSQDGDAGIEPQIFADVFADLGGAAYNA